MEDIEFLPLKNRDHPQTQPWNLQDHWIFKYWLIYSSKGSPFSYDWYLNSLEMTKVLPSFFELSEAETRKKRTRYRNRGHHLSPFLTSKSGEVNGRDGTASKWKCPPREPFPKEGRDRAGFLFAIFMEIVIKKDTHHLCLTCKIKSMNHCPWHVVSFRY